MAGDQDNKVGFIFNRGDKFSCRIVIVNKELAVLDKIVCPAETPIEVKKLFLEEAEKRAWEKFNETDDEHLNTYWGVE